MADNETPVLEDWEDLPLKVRRNRKHMYNYIKSVLYPDNEDKQRALYFFYIRRCIYLWISVDDVIYFHGLKPQHLNLEKTDTTKLEEIITDWISQSESLIKTYCHIKSIEDTDVSDAMKNVCLRLTSNMVSLAIQKRDNPIIKVNDWTIQGLSSEIFTDDLKADLDPFVNDASTDPSKLGIFAITGEGLDRSC